MPPVRRHATPPPSVAPYTLPPPRPAPSPPPPPRAFTFAPNVAAESFNEPPPLIVPQESTLFPSAPVPTPGDLACVPRKPSHARKKPDDWIPRPPNAFILFRSEFIKSQHVPGDVEANHGNLSKIIGLCWRNLPFSERDVWECKARLAMAAHKAKYPHYRFRPAPPHQSKHPPAHRGRRRPDPTRSPDGSPDRGGGGGDSPHHTPSPSPTRNGTPPPPPRRRLKDPPPPPDERRCAAIAALLVRGVKGDHLLRHVRELDEARPAEGTRDEPGAGTDAGVVVVPRFEAPVTPEDVAGAAGAGGAQAGPGGLRRSASASLRGGRRAHGASLKGHRRSSSAPVREAGGQPDVVGGGGEDEGDDNTPATTTHTGSLRRAASSSPSKARHAAISKRGPSGMGGGVGVFKLDVGRERAHSQSQRQRAGEEGGGESGGDTVTRRVEHDETGASVFLDLDPFTVPQQQQANETFGRPCTPVNTQQTHPGLTPIHTHAAPPYGTSTPTLSPASMRGGRMGRGLAVPGSVFDSPVSSSVFDSPRTPGTPGTPGGQVWEGEGEEGVCWGMGYAQDGAGMQMVYAEEQGQQHQQQQQQHLVYAHEVYTGVDPMMGMGGMYGDVGADAYLDGVYDPGYGEDRDEDVEEGSLSVGLDLDLESWQQHQQRAYAYAPPPAHAAYAAPLALLPPFQLPGSVAHHHPHDAYMDPAVGVGFSPFYAFDATAAADNNNSTALSTQAAAAAAASGVSDDDARVHHHHEQQTRPSTAAAAGSNADPAAAAGATAAATAPNATASVDTSPEACSTPEHTHTHTRANTDAPASVAVPVDTPTTPTDMAMARGGLRECEYGRGGMQMGLGGVVPGVVREGGCEGEGEDQGAHLQQHQYQYQHQHQHQHPGQHQDTDEYPHHHHHVAAPGGGAGLALVPCPVAY